MQSVRARSRLALALGPLVPGIALGIGLGFVPTPEHIGSSYFTAASAVIPLLLIAVLTRLADNRLANAGVIPRFEHLKQEQRETKDQLLTMRERAQAMKTQLAKREGDAEAAAAAKELEGLVGESLSMDQELELPLDGINDLASASIFAVIVVTVLAGMGEAAAFSQLATEGDSSVAFLITNCGMASLFLGVIYFELLPWLLIRSQHRAPAASAQADSSDRNS